MEAVCEQPVRLRRLGAATSGRKVRFAAKAVFVASVVAWALFLRPQALGGPATYLIVSGHSMEPTLHAGDLAVASRQRTYRRGDVIVYHIPKNQAGAGALVIHRIVGGSSRDGYVTRGDNRTYRDPWRPRPADIAGKMELHVPRLGMLPVFAHTAIGMAFIAALAGFLVLRAGTDARAGGDAAPASEELAPGAGGGEEPDDVRADAHTPGAPARELQPTSAASGVAAEPPELPKGGPQPVPAPAPEIARHLLFVWKPTGYELVERNGEPPAVGAVVDESARLYRVSKLAGSPLPADPRRCAYLEPA